MNKKLIDKLITEQNDSNYRTTIETTISVPGFDIDTVNVMVTWKLDMEVRSWGVKDISAYFTETPVHIEVEAVNLTGNKDETEPLTFTVDMSKIRIEWEAAGYMAPISMDLVMDSAGQVNYDASHIAFGYLAQAYY